MSEHNNNEWISMTKAVKRTGMGRAAAVALIKRDAQTRRHGKRILVWAPSLAQLGDTHTPFTRSASEQAALDARRASRWDD